jgi:ribonuclease HI
MKKITIYTDGACRGNPGPGGWGALLRFESTEKKIYGAEKLTTNNRMEMMAAIQALMLIKNPADIALYTDSQYLQKGVRDWLPGWKKNNWVKADKKPVKNADLWLLIDKLIIGHHIEWHWVKGHSGHAENDLVDRLANLGIDEFIKEG